MWAVDGRTQSTELLGSLAAERVLYEFDGPRIFTSRTREGALLLAYLCDQDGEVDRFLVAPANESEVAQLEQGALPVREALTRSWLWVVDRGRDGTLMHAWDCSGHALPADVLPAPGTPLLPQHVQKPIGSRFDADRRAQFRRAQDVVQQKGLWAA